MTSVQQRYCLGAKFVGTCVSCLHMRNKSHDYSEQIRLPNKLSTHTTLNVLFTRKLKVSEFTTLEKLYLLYFSRQLIVAIMITFASRLMLPKLASTAKISALFSLWIQSPGFFVLLNTSLLPIESNLKAITLKITLLSANCYITIFLNSRICACTQYAHDY